MPPREADDVILPTSSEAKLDIQADDANSEHDRHELNADIELGLDEQINNDTRSRLRFRGPGQRREQTSVDASHPMPKRNNRKSLSELIDKTKTDGGDLSYRLKRSIRAALGSFLHFSILIFFHLDFLTSAWTGNIMMHCCIKQNFGSSWTAVQGFAKSLFLVTCGSWVIIWILSALPLWAELVLLPPVIFVVSFLIMSCPFLVSRNLMILAMYVNVGPMIREDFEGRNYWQPFGLLGSWYVGLTIATLVNLLPIPRSNLATHPMETGLRSLRRQESMLFEQIEKYLANSGRSTRDARAAMASLNLLIHQINAQVSTLESLLPAVQSELNCRLLKVFRRSKSDISPITSYDRLSDWIAYLKKSRPLYLLLQAALSQRFLGEEYSANSSHAREIRQLIGRQLGGPMSELYSTLDDCLSSCIKYAALKCIGRPKKEDLQNISTKLRSSLENCRQKFSAMVHLAAESSADLSTGEINPSFAHISRRMVSFHSIFSICEGLLEFIDTKIIPSKDDGRERARSGQQIARRILVAARSTYFDAWWNPKWLWHKPESYRLAIKTAMGMSLASLWISVPYLNSIFEPYGVWPGLTIASISLSTTGSSFLKAADRLIGTLLAAAYALAVADFLLRPTDETNDIIKIPAIVVFTFIVMFFSEDAHAYRYTYAATSIGSMLYGSTDKDYYIASYVPKRIQLIFIGVIIFAAIELMVFSRSSKKIVEKTSTEYFDAMLSFLKESMRLVGNLGVSIDSSSMVNETTTRETQSYRKNIEELDEKIKQIGMNNTMIQAELKSAMNEPHFGAALPLDLVAFTGLAKEMKAAFNNATFLARALSGLDESTVERKSKDYLDACLGMATRQMTHCCSLLREAFPDGRIRPQCGNSMAAIAAAASFRDFEDIRLMLLSEWSAYYRVCTASSQASNLPSVAQGQSRGTDSREDESGGNLPRGFDASGLITYGVATSFLLELCRHLQKAGQNVELYVEKFPAPDSNLGLQCR